MIKKPRILLFDIETTPNISYTWGKWEQNVIKFKKEWEILCFAYKWLDEDKIHCFARMSEKNLTIKLWCLFDEADVIIAHNGDKFDIKKSKAKFLQYNLKPPSPYKTVDTLKIARQQFAFNSNSLGDLCKTLDIGSKIKTGGADLWMDCIDGKDSAWRKMIEYNKHDVVLLEQVYLKMRAWSPGHPNTALYDRLVDACPVCRSKNIIKKGERYLKTRSVQRYKCKDCGKYF